MVLSWAKKNWSQKMSHFEAGYVWYFLGPNADEGASLAWQRAKSLMADHIQSLRLPHKEYKGEIIYHIQSNYNTNERQTKIQMQIRANWPDYTSRIRKPQAKIWFRVKRNCYTQRHSPEPPF